MEIITGNVNMEIDSLKEMISQGQLSLEQLVDHVFEVINRFTDYHIWIHVASREMVLRRVRYLESLGDTMSMPLFGIPFAVKDNIDVAGMPTTAACKEYAYTPKKSAEAVRRLEEAGAICIGKTNLDQFATGLVGTRSPYGIVKNSINPDYISGGSSSGSAVAVALGMVSFALGTDTAGSGRVPAGFNNIVGLKPTKGLVSTNGVVPACKSLDCVSVFTLNNEDAQTVFEVISEIGTSQLNIHDFESFDFAVPEKKYLSFSGNKDYEFLYYQAIGKLINAGGVIHEIDFSPFLETAELLYEGPWVAERLAAIKDFFESNPNALLMETKKIIEGARDYSAVDTFLSLYKLDELKAKSMKELNGFDFLFVPTTPTIYKIEEILDEPFSLNKNLGYYTNFVNLLDLSAVAVPNGFGPDKLPMGVTLIGPAHQDLQLLKFAKIFHR